MLSGLTLSALTHIVLIVVLSLIALSNNSASTLNSLFVSQSPLAATTSLADLPVFEVVASAESLESTRAVPMIPEMNLQMPLPLLADSAASKTMVALQTQASKTDANVAVELEGASAKTVAVIQGRVSKAGGKPGEVQFALAWRNINDIDLHVIAPSGEHISHMHRRSHCNGLLDVDMNVSGESSEPIENIRWLKDAPWGRYTVLINLFRVHVSESVRTARQSPFQLLVQLGEESTLRDGVIRPSQQVAIFRFHYFPAHLTSAKRELLELELQELQSSEEAAAKPILADAKRIKIETDRDRLLQQVVRSYPHTDAAVEALRLMGGEVVKR